MTEGDYGVFGKSGIADIREKNYPYFLARILGCEARNFGKCGYTSTSYLANYETNGVKVEGSDIILVMLGTNGGLKPNDPTAQGNLDYAALIEKCRARAPLAKIILCTPPHATEDPQWSNCGYAEQVKEGVEFVRAYAKRAGLSVIETALCPEFTAENEKIMQPNDGLHFGEAGYEALANYIAAELKKLCPNL